MNSYIMQHAEEPQRIRFKTESLLVDHHLHWAGLQPGESFVDFGTASGEVTRAAARLVAPASVVGLDADPGALAVARPAAERLGLTNLRYDLAEIHGVGSSRLAADSYDHALTRFFLEYHPRPLEVISEMARVVRPGGAVTLIDVDGNCVWHHPLPEELRLGMDEILADLKQTGFDPYVGRKLATYAERAGLTDIRQAIEPYHRIVGEPDEHTAAAWRWKLETIKANYVDRLFPEKAHNAEVFDALLDFILRGDTMTWSLLYLVQGKKPSLGAPWSWRGYSRGGAGQQPERERRGWGPLRFGNGHTAAVPRARPAKTRDFPDAMYTRAPSSSSLPDLPNPTHGQHDKSSDPHRRASRRGNQRHMTSWTHKSRKYSEIGG